MEEDFVDLVYRLRTAQTEYFRTRKLDTLRDIKVLEKEVDFRIMDIQLRRKNNIPTDK